LIEKTKDGTVDIGYELMGLIMKYRVKQYMQKGREEREKD